MNCNGQLLLGRFHLTVTNTVFRYPSTKPSRCSPTRNIDILKYVIVRQKVVFACFNNAWCKLLVGPRSHYLLNASFKCKSKLNYLNVKKLRSTEVLTQYWDAVSYSVLSVRSELSNSQKEWIKISLSVLSAAFNFLGCRIENMRTVLMRTTIYLQALRVHRALL